HLDAHAQDIAERNNGAPDDLLSTGAVAGWLGVSTQFLEIGRHRGYGPPFVRLSVRRVRYKRADVLAWLAERTHSVTSEYNKKVTKTRRRPAATTPVETA
ncbi:MAG: hypothetical protein WAN51_11145, partial [Alphaproteobacteria bacterium]